MVHYTIRLYGDQLKSVAWDTRDSQGGDCRLESCLMLNGGSVNSDEILCEYLELRVRSIEEVLTLPGGTLNPIKPLPSLVPCLLLL